MACRSIITRSYPKIGICHIPNALITIIIIVVVVVCLPCLFSREEKKKKKEKKRKVGTVPNIRIVSEVN